MQGNLTAAVDNADSKDKALVCQADVNTSLLDAIK